MDIQIEHEKHNGRYKVVAVSRHTNAGFTRELLNALFDHLGPGTVLYGSYDKLEQNKHCFVFSNPVWPVISECVTLPELQLLVHTHSDGSLRVEEYKQTI